MQPPPPGPYGGPPFSAPAGAHWGPPRRVRRRTPAVVAGAIVLMLAVIAGVLVYTHGSRGDKGFAATPGACSLLSRSQVAAYVTGAVSDGGGDTYFCQWSKPVGAKDQTGRLTVGVEVLPGDRPSVKDAAEEYAIRRRQSDRPGTTITPLSLGDESFLACEAPTNEGPGDCTTYTRVRNVVFSLKFESFPAPGEREPALSVRALAAEAVERLRRSA